LILGIIQLVEVRYEAWRVTIIILLPDINDIGFQIIEESTERIEIQLMDLEVQIEVIMIDFEMRNNNEME
jgi:hypothetical protein